jgi:hypothetical protein
VDTVDRLITRVELQGEAGVVRGLSGIGNAMKEFAALAAVGATLDFLKGAVQEAMEAEKVAARFTATNKALGASWPVEEAQAYASALQRVTVLDDEDIVNAMQRLLLLKMSRQQIEQIMPAIADMSAEFADSGMTATEAAEKIGRAYSSGNIAMLRRFGIVIDEALFKKDKFRALTEALARFQGQAAALRGTAGGSLTAFAEQWANLKQAIGDLFLPSLIAVMPYLTMLLEWAQKIVPYLKGIVSPFLQIADVLQTVKAFMGLGDKATKGAAAKAGAGGAGAGLGMAGETGFKAATRAFLGGGAIGRIGMAASELPDIRARANNAPITVRVEGDDSFETFINRVLAQLTRHGVIRPATG